MQLFIANQNSFSLIRHFSKWDPANSHAISCVQSYFMVPGHFISIQLRISLRFPHRLLQNIVDMVYKRPDSCPKMSSRVTNWVSTGFWTLSRTWGQSQYKEHLSMYRDHRNITTLSLMRIPLLVKQHLYIGMSYLPKLWYPHFLFFITLRKKLSNMYDVTYSLSMIISGII